MSENNIDKLMKSMLENAQEEVPAHIWDGVSSGLDKAAKRAAAFVWWRRAAIGVAAAAVAVGFVFGGKSVQPSEPVGEMIAVVEMPADTDQAAMDMTVGQTHPELVLMAEAEIPQKPESEFRPSSVSDAMDRWSDTSEETGSEDAGTYREGSIEAEEHAEAEKHAEAENVDGQKTDYDTDTMLQDDIDWGEEEDGKAGRESRTSLVLSGMTGTNSIQNGAKANIMKRPSLSGIPAQTGITETSTNTAYGIPVSVGAGVKIGLNDKWSLGVGANYSLLSRKFYGTFTKADNGTEISSTSSDIRNLQHFIGIPINAYRTLLDNKHINLYTYFGGTVEKCVADNYEILSTNITHTEKPSGVQISANIGLGVEFMIGKHLGLYADPSLRYYFDNGQPKSIRTSQPLMLGLDVGLRIKL
jgi:hypothetical protein